MSLRNVQQDCGGFGGHGSAPGGAVSSPVARASAERVPQAVRHSRRHRKLCTRARRLQGSRVAGALETGGHPSRGDQPEDTVPRNGSCVRNPAVTFFNLAGALKHDSLVSYSVSVRVVRWLLVDVGFDDTVSEVVVWTRRWPARCCCCSSASRCSSPSFVCPSLLVAGFGCCFAGFLGRGTSMWGIPGTVFSLWSVWLVRHMEGNKVTMLGVGVCRLVFP